MQYEVTYVTDGEEYSSSLEQVLKNCSNRQNEIVSVMFRGYTQFGHGQYTLITKTEQKSANLFPNLYSSYSGYTGLWQVHLNGEVVYGTSDSRDAHLFMAQLKHRV